MTPRDLPLGTNSHAVTAGIVLEAVKEFDGFERIPLSPLVARPQGSRHLIGAVLHEAAGTIAAGLPGYAPSECRANYSVGAAYPIDLYVMSFDAELRRGIHYYDPGDHELLVLSEASPAEAYASLLPKSGNLPDGSLVILLVGAFGRSTFEYGDRGYRHVLLDAGILVERLRAGFRDGGRSVLLLPDVVDDALNDHLRINGTDEALLFAMRIGPANTS